MARCSSGLPRFAQEEQASLRIDYREFPGGPYFDPPDARFDVFDPSGTEVASNVPTTVLISPGRHVGNWPIPAGAEPGEWIMHFEGTLPSGAAEQDCSFCVVAQSVLQGPCEPWPIDDECCEYPEAATAEQIDRQTAIATELLWTASGRRFGPCPVTIRPCARNCDGSGRWHPYKDSGGSWRNFVTCGCAGGCSCTELCEVSIAGPVSSITEVVVDGIVLDSADYRLDLVDRGWRLLRIDGECWPTCQDYRVACDEPDGFCITYDKGLDLPELATAAVSELTCELVKACIPGCDCKLPRNVVSKTRQGMTLQFENATTWLKSLPNVMAFIDSYNPKGLAQASRAWSPDVPPHRVVPTETGS